MIFRFFILFYIRFTLPLQMNMMENLIGEVHRPGRIEVVCGSMFSGKTEELIRRMKRAKFAKQRVEIFKPSIDVRYSEENVVSHDHNAIHSTPIDSSSSILLLADDIDVLVHSEQIGIEFEIRAYEVVETVENYPRVAQRACDLGVDS